MTASLMRPSSPPRLTNGRSRTPSGVNPSPGGTMKVHLHLLPCPLSPYLDDLLAHDARIEESPTGEMARAYGGDTAREFPNGLLLRSEHLLDTVSQDHAPDRDEPPGQRRQSGRPTGLER